MPERDVRWRDIDSEKAAKAPKFSASLYRRGAPIAFTRMAKAMSGEI